MSDLRELYQDVILDHYRHPRHAGKLESATHHAEGNNPLCGDRLAVDLEVSDGVIADLGITCTGCAISTASASLMGEAVKGATVDEAEALARRFHATLLDRSEIELDELGDLAALTGVREFPMRVKCATLAWHTLLAAIAAAGSEPSVTTE